MLLGTDYQSWQNELQWERSLSPVDIFNISHTIGRSFLYLNYLQYQLAYVATYPMPSNIKKLIFKNII